MALQTEDARILIKRSTTASEIPTIPSSNDHTDGSWIKTDIYVGEIFINVVDDLAWVRTNNGLKPIELGVVAGSIWKQGGNSFGALGVLGTTDTYGLSIITNNVERIAIDSNGNTTIQGITFGLGAGYSTSNSAVGLRALSSNTTGTSNHAHGRDALKSNTTGKYLSAFGDAALYSTTVGDYSTALGNNALVLWNDTNGKVNDAYGSETLRSLATGDGNLAVGYLAGADVNGGNYNTFIGQKAGRDVLTGSGNIAIGYRSNSNGVDVSNKLIIGNNTDSSQPIIYGDITNGRIGIGTTTTTARLVLPANSASASGGQIKLILGGSLMATPENGAIEAINSHIYWTDSTGTRYQLDQQTSGSWTGSLITPAYGGTGVANGSNNTITFTGNYTLGLTLSANTAVTLPTTGTLSTLAGTETLTNKRITPRTGTTVSSATPTINTDNVDFYSITALAAAITSFTTNLSGTPTNAQTLLISITDDGTARAITWGTSFESSTATLPTTTVVSTRLDVAFIWNTATSKWRCIGVA